MSDETNAKPADASGTGEPQTPTGEPVAAAHASEGQDKPFPGGQPAGPGPVPPYQVPQRPPARVTFTRVVRNSAVQLAGAGLVGGLIGGGVVALAAHDHGGDRRPTFSRQFQNQGTTQQRQFPGYGGQGQGQQGQQQDQNQQQDPFSQQQGDGFPVVPG
jgi:hypothetical protein